MSARAIGWDIGGAHLKAAAAEGGRLTHAVQVPCALWLGLDRLATAFAEVARALPAGGAARHAVTMTGEMADLFPDRASGVRAILEAARGALGGARLLVYAEDGFVESGAAEPARVASANWHATATWAARAAGDALLVDIGSTTTDFVPLRGGRAAPRAIGDAARLAAEELVYTGVVRTPVMAVAEALPFGGERVGVAAEVFATMADAHRLTGALPEGADQQPSADGRGKSFAESRARLARMVGRDAAEAGDAAWDALARAAVERQTERLLRAAERVVSAAALPAGAPLIGAGVGRFLVPELARRLGRPYRSLAAMLPADDPAVAERAADAAPAAALALLVVSA